MIKEEDPHAPPQVDDKYADYLKKLEASGKAKIREADEADYHVHKCRLVVLEPV